MKGIKWGRAGLVKGQMAGTHAGLSLRHPIGPLGCEDKHSKGFLP